MFKNNVTETEILTEVWTMFYFETLMILNDNSTTGKQRPTGPWYKSGTAGLYHEVIVFS